MMMTTMTMATLALQLKQAADDNAQFDQAIEAIRADRSIKAADMRDLARLFLGYELAKKKGREDALKEIIQRQAIAARQAARGALLDRGMNAW